MENIIAAVDRALLKRELSTERFIRKTRKGDNEIYIVNQHNAPHVLQEIGRLREITFRASGGGTGLSVDLDNFDLCEKCYQQLIVWSPEDEEIVGGYRYIRCADAIDRDSGEIQLSTTHYFDFSERFISDYLPYTIELGRSWVQIKSRLHPYQSRQCRHPARVALLRTKLDKGWRIDIVCIA